MLKSLHSVFDSSYITFWKRQNHGDNKKISGCQGTAKKEKWIDRMQKILSSVKVFCMILKMVDMCSYTFV